MRRRMLMLLAALGCMAVWANPAAGAAFTQQELKITMSDGARLAASYFEPVGPPPAAGWPAVVLLHGLGHTRVTGDFRYWSPNRMASELLAPEGYAVLTFDARAHGESGGLFTLDGPRELQDLRELLAWLTAHPEIDAQHVGACGVSYGGGLVWRAAVEKLPFAAIVPAATWTDLREALAPQGHVRAGIIVGFSQNIPRDRYGAEEAALLGDAILERNIAALRPYLASRSTRPRLGEVNVPTFMLQGRRDFAFDADQALAAYTRLRGPKRLYLGDLGHAPAANPPDEFAYASLEVRQWFDRFLKGIPNGIDTKAPIELAPDPWSPKTASYRSIPATKKLSFSFAGTRSLSAAGKVVRTSKAIRHAETFGTPVAKVTFSSSGYRHLVVVLSALRADGTELVVADGAADTSAIGPKPRTATIRLQNEITSIPAGARLRLTIGARSTVQSIGNLVYLNPVPDEAHASIRRVSLTLRVLKRPASP